MAVWQIVTNINNNDHDEKRLAELRLTLETGVDRNPDPFGVHQELSSWQMDRVRDSIAYTERSIAKHTFNEATDEWLIRNDEKRYENKVKRFVPESVGRTFAIEHKSTYLGDGDSNYYVLATIINDDGSTTGVHIDGNGWYPTSKVHENGSFVDVADELVTLKLDRDERLRKEAEREKFLDMAYNVEEAPKGTYIVVDRGRKVPIGTTGQIFWVGENRWGKSVGFNDRQGNTHFTSINNVAVVPYVEDDVQCSHGKPVIGPCERCDA